MEPQPKLERVERILGEISAILERSIEATVAKLKPFVEMEPEEGEVFATLELFSDQNFCLTYNQFFVKEKDGKKILDTKWDVTDASAESLIPELDEYETKVFDGVDYSDAEVKNFGPRQAKKLSEWFFKCWNLAGGEQSKVPTYFAMNKEYMCQNMATGEMLTEEEAASRSGAILIS